MREEKAKEKLTEEERKTVEDEMEAGMKWMESHAEAETQEFKDYKKSVEEKVRPVILKMHGATDYSDPAGPVKYGEASTPEQKAAEEATARVMEEAAKAKAAGPKVEEVD
jgi:L1 cell adhesion molecule like protein